MKMFAVEMRLRMIKISASKLLITSQGHDLDSDMTDTDRDVEQDVMVEYWNNISANKIKCIFRSFVRVHTVTNQLHPEIRMYI